MNVEQFLYSRLGVRKEYPKTNFFATALFVGGTRLYAKRTGLTVNGFIPSEGPGLFVTNHVKAFDAACMWQAGLDNIRTEGGEAAIGRIIRAVGKYPLLHPFAKESAKVREETGKKGWLNSDNFLVKLLNWAFLAPPLRAVGTIGIRRGETDRVALGEINQAFEDDQLIAMSLVPTRVEDGTLEYIQMGLAFIIKTNSNVPFFLVGISPDGLTVNISPGQTYNQLKNEKGPMNTRNLTLELADGITALQNPTIQASWKETGRELERQRLYHKKQTPNI